MEIEDGHRIGILGYDERTETWYLEPGESHRLMLTRQSLARLVQMYNSIHKGSPLVLLGQREVQRLEETRREHVAALRESHLRRDRRWSGVLRGVWRRLCPSPRDAGRTPYDFF